MGELCWRQIKIAGPESTSLLLTFLELNLWILKQEARETEMISSRTRVEASQAFIDIVVLTSGSLYTVVTSHFLEQSYALPT